MKLLEKSDKEILEIAQPIWDNLVKSSNIKDYGGFTKDFSSQMLYGANEVELGKQWANNKLLTSLSKSDVTLINNLSASFLLVVSVNFLIAFLAVLCCKRFFCLFVSVCLILLIADL